jgi:hypothetical protein
MNVPGGVIVGVLKILIGSILGERGIQLTYWTPLPHVKTFVLENRLFLGHSVK